MKTQHGGVKTAEECQHLSEAHRQRGSNIVTQHEEPCKDLRMEDIAESRSEIVRVINVAKDLN